MATLALSVVGGLVGGALGGPVGAAFGRGLGALAGAAIDASLFAPKPQSVEGPRLSDLSVTTSAYGQPIPLAWGQRVRLGGNVIWATPLQETATRRKSGGKGGGGKQSSTTYSYSTSFAIVFCEGPITGITRIWGDGKLLYDSTATPPCARAGAVRIHLGTETQLADSRIAAEVGAADCPAYRGLAYVVFEDLQLADFGNRIPQITAELALASPAVSIAAAALAARAGVTTLEVASVAEPLAGFVVARQTTARAAIEALMMGAALTAAAVPGGAQLRPRGTLPLAGIDVTALGAAENDRPPGEAWRAARAEESALPRVLELVFMDPARDYQSNTARSWRSIGASQGSQTTELAMVLDASTAKARAEQAHRDLWAGRTTLEGITLPPRYGWIQAGEGLELRLGGAWRRLAVTAVAIGANGLVQLKAAVEQAGLWSPHVATADAGILPANTAPGIVPSTAHLLDLPLLRAEDDDAGFYVALGGPAGWRSGVLLRSADGISYDDLLAVAEPAIIGNCQTILPDGPWWCWDAAATVEVQLLDPGGSLAGVTEAEVLAGANTALIGQEILQFRAASLIGPGRYQLSGLLRGRLGTDHHTGAHAPGERFVLLSGGAGLERVRDSLALRGLARQYKPVSLYQDASAVVASGFANSAEGLRPLSPVHLAGHRDAAGSLTITWIRRSRIPAGWSDGTDLPLGEASERYEVEIRNAACTATLRSIVTTGPTASYNAAEQAADFGSVPGATRLRVRQLSDIAGRGTAREAIL